MILPDVNVLLNAFRSDALDHPRHRVWLDGVLNGPSNYAMAPQVLSGVIRIATNRRIYAVPDPLHTVLTFTEAISRPDHCRLVQPGPLHWGIFTQLCEQAAASGNLVQDAWFAALAIESGCEWITNDRDFARFPGLRWRTPF